MLSNDIYIYAATTVGGYDGHGGQRVTYLTISNSELSGRMLKKLELLILLCSLFCASPVMWAQTPCTPTGTGVCRYVATNGSDSGPGTSAQPYLTIQHAADVVNPGDEVIVRAGTYTDLTLSGQYSHLIQFSRGGTQANPVVFVSDVQYGAIIEGNNNTIYDAINFSTGADWIVVKGFTFRNFSHAGIVYYDGGSNADIVGNDFGDIGRICTNSSLGRQAIFVARSTGITIERNFIHDIGRFNIGENGCNLTAWQYYQQLDHGVYVHDATSNVTFKNNLFYRNLEGWSIVFNLGGGFTNETVVNNTFLWSKWGTGVYNIGQVAFYASCTSCLVENNISYQPNTDFIQFYAATGYSATTIANNITFGGAVSDKTPSGITFSNNRDNADPLLVAVGSSAIDGTAPNPHLQATSPALNAGLAIPSVTNDLYGTLRPLGLAYDIGSVEMSNVTASRPNPPQNLGATAH